MRAFDDRRLYDGLVTWLEAPVQPGRLLWEQGDTRCYADFDTLTWVSPKLTYSHQVEGVEVEVWV